MFRYFLAFLIFGSLAADGLSDLKAALGRYSAKTTVKGTLEAQVWSRQGKGRDAVESRGRASAWVEYNSQGLRMQWSRPFLQQLDTEARSRMKRGPSDNQASNALWAMELRRTYNLLDGSGELLRMIDAGVFQSESRETRNGKQTRVLQFSLPQTGAPERFRKWIKDYESTAKIWIDDEGNPIACQQNIQINARAFLVISFEQTQQINIAYSKVGDHLVCLSHEDKQEGGGGGEYGVNRTLRTFRPQ